MSNVYLARGCAKNTPMPPSKKLRQTDGACVSAKIYTWLMYHRGISVASHCYALMWRPAFLCTKGGRERRVGWSAKRWEKESGRVEKASEGGCHAEKASHSCVKPNQAQSASLWRNVPTDCVFSVYLKLKLLHAHCCIPLSSALKASSGVDEKLIQVAPGKLWVTCASNVHTSTNFSTKEWLQCSYICLLLFNVDRDLKLNIQNILSEWCNWVIYGHRKGILRTFCLAQKFPLVDMHNIFCLWEYGYNTSYVPT